MVRGVHGSRTGGYGSESPVPVLETIEPESNCKGISRLRFRFPIGGFPMVFYGFHGFEPPVFAVPAWNRWFRHGFGSKNFEPEPNHGSQIDGFGSEKFSRFRFGIVTGGYGFDFNRRFGKPWAGLIMGMKASSTIALNSNLFQCK